MRQMPARTIVRRHTHADGERTQVETLDEFAALRLQLEWGADEALADEPIDRFVAARPTLATPAHSARVPSPPPALPVAAPPSSAAAIAAAAHDLPSLHAAMDAFEGCALRHTASSTVAPSGNPAAALLCVTEVPSPDDDRSGRSLSGALGERVDRILASAGLSREQLLFTPLIPWRPPGGRPVSEAEIAVCLPFFHRLLALAQPARMVLMGAGPFKILSAGAVSFRRARGTWKTVQPPGLPPLPALPMLAPEVWLSTAANKQAVWADLLTLHDALRPTT